MITLLRARFFKFRIQRRLRSEAAKLKVRNEPIRMVIGAGRPLPCVGAPGSAYAGWLCTDVSTLDALNINEWRSIFRPSSVSTILAEHVIEHWTTHQFRGFLNIVREFLSPLGFVRIAVPDGFHPSATYIDQVKPGGSGPGAEDHKVLYDYQTLSSLLSKEGFAPDLLEYFDEKGEFHRTTWHAEDGLIQRSEHHDARNRERPLAYTSLIVDCRPPPAT
jgi:predicted SAM-dependent methyltransferase